MDIGARTHLHFGPVTSIFLNILPRCVRAAYSSYGRANVVACTYLDHSKKCVFSLCRFAALFGRIYDRKTLFWRWACFFVSVCSLGHCAKLNDLAIQTAAHLPSRFPCSMYGAIACVISTASLIIRMDLSVNKSAGLSARTKALRIFHSRFYSPVVRSRLIWRHLPTSKRLSVRCWERRALSCKNRIANDTRARPSIVNM